LDRSSIVPLASRLVGAWHLANAEAVNAVQWLIVKVNAAVANSESALR
jgi:hypothetical protein